MSRVLSKSDYDALLQGKSIVNSSLGEYDIGYNVIPILISYLENIKKREGSVSYSLLKEFVDHLSNGTFPFVSEINLEQSDISNAILDEEFLKNEIGKQNNPYFLSSYIAIKFRNEDEAWWDVDELLSQLNELKNGYI